MTTTQDSMVDGLQKKGFKYLSDFWTGDEFTVVMKNLSTRVTVEIEPDGYVHVGDGTILKTPDEVAAHFSPKQEDTLKNIASLLERMN